MKKLLFSILTVLLISSANSLASERKDARPLYIGIKTGALFPADGDFKITNLVGVDVQFQLNSKYVLLIEHNFSATKDYTPTVAPAPGLNSKAGSNFSAVSITKFPRRKSAVGFYYGLGVARATYRINANLASGGLIYTVTSEPTRLGGLVTIGYGGRSRLFIEAKYLYTGKKRWSPVGGDNDLGGLTLSTGYRFTFR